MSTTDCGNLFPAICSKIGIKISFPGPVEIELSLARRNFPPSTLVLVYSCNPIDLHALVCLTCAFKFAGFA